MEASKALEEIKSVTFRDMKEILKMKTLPSETAKVMNTLYYFHGHTEQHDIVNYQQKIITGMIQIPNILVEFKLNSLTQKQVLTAETSLKSIDQDSLLTENETAHKLYSWMNAIIKSFHEEIDSEVQEDVKVPQEEIKVERQPEKEAPIIRSEIAQRLENLVGVQAIESLPAPQSDTSPWEDLVFTVDQESFSGSDKVEFLKDICQSSAENFKNADAACITELKSLNNPPEVCIKI